tara:strand:+ start:795 stop:1475 length:681 start_codon:yes stop_codon:yes gene_type:complete
MPVNFPNSPSNGATHTVGSITYVYDSAKGVWKDSPAGLTQGIDALTDVDISTAAPSTGDLLQWNGTNFVPYTHTNGITHVDTWRITSNITSDAIPITTWTHTAPHSSLMTTLGTAMSHSSGVFNFPVTGFWEIQFIAQWQITGNDNVSIAIQAYESDGTTTRTLAQGSVGDTSFFQQINLVTYLNCTSTTNNKVQFYVNGISSANVIGDSGRDKTYVVFKRIGDSQ